MSVSATVSFPASLNKIGLMIKVGTLTCGLGTYIALRRRRPPVYMGLRLLGGGAMGMMGSFIGFTIGGAAASMEVERNMADAPR